VCVNGEHGRKVDGVWEELHIWIFSEAQPRYCARFSDNIHSCRQVFSMTWLPSQKNWTSVQNNLEVTRKLKPISCKHINWSQKNIQLHICDTYANMHHLNTSEIGLIFGKLPCNQEIVFFVRQTSQNPWTLE